MVVTKNSCGFILCVWLLFGTQGHAQVLPEDRVDSLYHIYDGGGITVQGPSVLVRKSVADTVSVSANYYVDSISSASVDVVTLGASRYAEERTQLSGSIEYLYENSILSYAYTNSSENDYEAVTSNLSIAQEMFGGLTTVALGFKSGNNVVKNSTNPSFEDTTDIKGYRLSLSQVITKNILLGSAYEIITDSGYLNNPYRQVRYIDTSQALGYSFEPEVYPQSHTSNAVGFNIKYFLPYRAACSGGYRYYIDSWDITADTIDVSYVHPLNENWLLDFSYRFYSQTSASFYNDLFPYQTAQNYLARDKELSTYSSHSIGLGVTYKLGRDQLVIVEKGSLNLYLTAFSFQYDDFRDVPAGRDNNLMGGTEPMYDFNAYVIRSYLSIWF
ncbi:MAG: DUF3570 domain-containing protein [Gammaproteobacteria bacterium]|nr:DUF3570 domain-containing protein [Gammaproteobacteria bacterium]